MRRRSSLAAANGVDRGTSSRLKSTPCLACCARDCRHSRRLARPDPGHRGGSRIGNPSVVEIPKTMKAVLLKGYGGFDQLEYRDDVPVPAARAGELLIRVAA